jgi:DNA repair photolyase
MNAQLWHRPAVIADNHFVNKSLSCWSYNVAVGCGHACRFCYVPDVSTIRLSKTLAERGVQDPDEEWGDYVMVRPWDEQAFRASLRKAEKRKDLNPDGNRAVMFCTTTDPYQVLPPPYQGKLETVVRRALEIIRDESTLNVRILTRSPLARRDFDVMQSFGKRLMFGMSIPTIDPKLARVYEPKAPAPAKRMETLMRAAQLGIPVYVAIAPTYPEMTDNDLYDVLIKTAAVNPLTIFHEPINIRAENVARIREHAESLGVSLNWGVWVSKETWAEYNVKQLSKVETIAEMLDLKSRLHLWPDAELARLRPGMTDWFATYWNRISEWPS